jgi:threonine dehydrogenase-like Zn-dependent dehydrogenase
MTVNWSPFVVDEITLVGSRCGPFAPALRLLESARVDPAILIAAQYPLANALEAMSAARKPGMLKVLLKP